MAPQHRDGDREIPKMKENIDLFEELTEVYHAFAQRDWECVIKHYKNNPGHLLYPMNLNKDSALHLAVYSKDKKPFEDLFKIAIRCQNASPEDALSDVIRSENSTYNNVLHEAAVVGNVEVVKYFLLPQKENNEQDSVVQKHIALIGMQLLSAKNLNGETPLFTAAAFGNTEVVELLWAEYMRQDLLKEENLTRYDCKTILHVAIQGEHFETALLLLRNDPSLSHIEDNDGNDALQMLASRPTAFWSGYSNDSIIDRVIYFCLPANVLHHPNNNQRWSQCRSQFNKFHGWSKINKIWSLKKKHLNAVSVAKKLIKLTGWSKYKSDQFNSLATPLISLDSPNPLFLATWTGITEIVEETLRVNPQAIEQCSQHGQNILHLVVMRRRKDIFYMLKDMGDPWIRITKKVDNSGRNLLHRVADTEYYTGGTKPSPAFKLQEELQWFARVREEVPSYYLTTAVSIPKDTEKLNERAGQIISIHEMQDAAKNEVFISSENVARVTPMKIFELRHQKQLEEAQTWIKATAESCSTVSVLVAGVVFAAAYTVPGGFNDRGLPILQTSSYFYFFTIMDIIALACSLTSVVAFLSILTSSFEMKDFKHSIPRKLSFGFSLLFFSIISTMLAFSANILLIIQIKRDWTTSLISLSGFFPVTVFALLQLHLNWAIIVDIFEPLLKILDNLGVSSLFCQKKQRKHKL